MVICDGKPVRLRGAAGALAEGVIVFTVCRPRGALSLTSFAETFHFASDRSIRGDGEVKDGVLPEIISAALTHQIEDARE
jgi:hypothetical protein